MHDCNPLGTCDFLFGWHYFLLCFIDRALHVRLTILQAPMTFVLRTFRIPILISKRFLLWINSFQSSKTPQSFYLLSRSLFLNCSKLPNNSRRMVIKMKNGFSRKAILLQRHDLIVLLLFRWSLTAVGHTRIITRSLKLDSTFAYAVCTQGHLRRGHRSSPHSGNRYCPHSGHRPWPHSGHRPCRHSRHWWRHSHLGRWSRSAICIRSPWDLNCCEASKDEW